MLSLPIDAYLPQVCQALAGNPSVIIEAPPGTGKTTRVAPALLTGNPDSQTLLIQPRRIAARTAATRIADEMGEALGDRVGYQIRFASCRSAATELTCMTPGILLRRLQRDVVLERVQHILLDEFHERSVEYDLLLGMLHRIQSEIRPELRLIVMSATLESEPLERFLGSPPVIRVEADVFPVKIAHTPFAAGPISGRRGSLSRRISEATVELTQNAVRQSPGDCLVFLPGAGEIHQVARALQPCVNKNNWLLHKLYGEMRPEEQDQVLRPAERRKLILATNIAETSLTIEGVRVVVDSGYARVNRFDPGAGLDLLSLEPICMASAAQRTGRAGRTAPGVCYRLWDKAVERGRAAQLEPEIHRVDLAGPVLQLLCWGETDIDAFPWLTPPRSDSVRQAFELLGWLGAIEEGAITDLGRRMVRLPVHPRLARLLLAGQRLQLPATAARAAAILSERDIFPRGQPENRLSTEPSTHASSEWDCDVTQRVQALEQFAEKGDQDVNVARLNTAAARHALRVARQFEQILRREAGALEDQASSSEQASRSQQPELKPELDTEAGPAIDSARRAGAQLRRALLSAFPDRLCKRRQPGQPRGLMVGGRGVKLDAKSGVRHAQFWLAIQADGRGSEAVVRIATSVELAWLPPSQLSEEVHRFFNPTLGAVVSRRRTRWHDLVLSESPVSTPADGETAALLSREVARQFHNLLPKNDKELQSWLKRIEWLNHELPELHLPSLEPQDLPALLQPYCLGLTSLAEVKKLPWKSMLYELLNHEQRSHLDRYAPATYQLPGGRRVFLHYEIGKAPILAARIQEFFGMRETPRIAGGKVALTLHLLAPNGRCQQVTSDLESFWENTYTLVRKQLRGRYPKHAWPEDPFQK